MSLRHGVAYFDWDMKNNCIAVRDIRRCVYEHLATLPILNQHFIKLVIGVL